MKRDQRRSISKPFVGGMSAVIALFVTLIVCASILLPFFRITIDKFFLGQGADMSAYDNTKARIVCEEIEAEAQVLLRNKGVLPIAASAEKHAKVCLYGVGGAHMKYAGSGSGGGNATGADTRKDALTANNILPCEELYAFYESKGETGSTGGFGDIGVDIGSSEVSVDAISDAVKQTALEYSDTAIYVLSRVGAEGMGFTNDILCMTNNEERTLDHIVENYDNVIVLLNTANQQELGFIDGVGVSRVTGESFSKYAGKIDAALWVGVPGYTGANAIGDVLAGKVNPSGRLPDTYAYDSDSAPSVHAVGNAEGIYIGYRWYETAAYEGAIDYDGYERNVTVPWAAKPVATGVQFPFGYGIGYTTFSKEIVPDGTTPAGTAFTDGNKDATVRIDVKVTNTGNAAGKEVVQLYCTRPYEDGDIEKPYVELIAFGKTELLEPGASETVTLSFSLSDMKSFDNFNANGNSFYGYELEKGTYLLRVLDNAHDWVNVDENSPLCLAYEVAEDILYPEDTETGNAVARRFAAYADGREYLSRADGFANASVNLEANLHDYEYDLPEIDDGAFSYERGKDYEVELSDPIMFEEMRDVAYEDEKWNEFISQLSKTEMATLIAMGNFQTTAVERLGIPKTLLFDGPAAIKDTYKSDVGCLLYPSEVSVAATWSKDVGYAMGASAGDDAKQCGVTGWYAPGVNLHTNAYGSRNFEYYSECPLLSGEMAASVSRGAWSQGVIVFVKHLIDGASETLNEQSMREIYARPFEIAIKKGDVHGLMTSDDVLGAWIGQVKEFITDIVRGEWGFCGMITSDAASAKMQVTYGIRAGNDIWLATDNARYTTLVREEKDIAAMQQCCKNILYTISRSDITFSSQIVDAGWSPSMLIMGLVDGISGSIVLIALFFLVRHIISVRKVNAIVIKDIE